MSTISAGKKRRNGRQRPLSPAALMRVTSHLWRLRFTFYQDVWRRLYNSKAISHLHENTNNNNNNNNNSSTKKIKECFQWRDYVSDGGRHLNHHWDTIENRQLISPERVNEARQSSRFLINIINRWEMVGSDYRADSSQLLLCCSNWRSLGYSSMCFLFFF